MTKSNSELDLKLLVYLDKRLILTDMQKACEVFLDQLNEKTICKLPPLRYLFQVDVMDLIEFFPDLGENLIKEPLKWQRYCNDILFACLKSLDNSTKQHVQSSQVAVIIRLKCLPHMLTKSKQYNYEGIVSSYGVLVDISKPSNYVYHTVWSCSEECEGNEIILQYIPKIPPKCYICRSVLFENSRLRTCGEQVEALFKFKNSILPKKYTVVDDLIRNLRLGATYFINAIVLNKVTAIWCLEETVTLSAPVTIPIPQDIKMLFKECDSKPWKFIYCLASAIGVNVCPLNCFMNVKISLLMSLVSIKSNIICDSPILHCLVASSDNNCYIGELMRQASLLANSNVFLVTPNCSTSTALIAASGGICVTTLPLQTYSQKQIHSIVQAIETGEIIHGSQMVKLKCAVWAHGKDFKRIVLYDIGNVFGTVCRADDGEYNEKFADFILQQALEPPEVTREEKQSLNDISEYIDLVAGLRVSMDVGAENLISSYFLAARRERSNAVTIGNIGALIATCLTSARLCHRSIANIEDAVFAIWLHVCAMSAPRFAPEEYLQTPANITRLQKITENFTDWLEKFTDCQIFN